MSKFTNWLEIKLGTREWVVASRLTDNLRGQGYDLALSQKRFSELETEWERETYGAPLASLHAAAPDMLEALRLIVAPQPYGATQAWRDNVQTARAKVHAAIAKAEGIAAP